MSDSRGVVALTIIFLVVAILLFRNVGEVVDWYADSVHIGQRTGGNIIAGSGLTVTATDDPTNNRVNFTLKETATSYYGTVTLLATTTSITLFHGIGSTPDRVFISPMTDTLDLRWWVSNIGASSFTVSTNASGVADITWVWEAIKD